MHNGHHQLPGGFHPTWSTSYVVAREVLEDLPEQRWGAIHLRLGTSMWAADRTGHHGGGI